MKKEKLFEELERMAQDLKGMLCVCSFPDCGKIEVISADEDYWFSREENPKLYDKVLGNYEKREKDLNDFYISHTFCPTCYKKKLDELEKRE